MTAPLVKDTLGRPPVELTLAPDGGTIPSAFVQIAGDTMTGDLTAPHFIGNGVAVTNLAWTNLTGIPTTIGAFGFTDFNSLGDARWVQLANVGVASGVASLDGTGKVPTSQLPAFSFGHVFTVASQAAMLALSTAVAGDLAVRSDISDTFILSATPASTLGNWVQLLSPGGTVSSVYGRTGAVTATAGDVAYSDLSGIPTDFAGFGLLTELHTAGDARWLALTGGTVTGFTSFARTTTTTAPVTGADEEGLQSSITWNPSSATTNNNPIIGVYGVAQIDGSYSAWGAHQSFIVGVAGVALAPSTRTADIYGILGLWGIVQKQNTTGNAHFLNAAIMRADNWGGTVDQHNGIEIQLTVGTGGAAAVSTLARSLWVHAPTITHAGSGGTSAYGIYIDNYASVPFSGYTNAWALYVEGGDVYLGGNLTVGGVAKIGSAFQLDGWAAGSSFGSHSLGVLSHQTGSLYKQSFSGFDTLGNMFFQSGHDAIPADYDPPGFYWSSSTGNVGGTEMAMLPRLNDVNWSDLFLATSAVTRSASILNLPPCIAGSHVVQWQPNTDVPSFQVMVAGGGNQADVMRFLPDGYGLASA
ncbi:MAG: hypothetical protein ABI119_11045, partial [Gemmatimonadaceae bacterium]